MSSLSDYDVLGAADGADAYDIGQGIGAAGEESLHAVGKLFGETGDQIAQTTIDFIDAGAEGLANTVSGWF